MILPFSTIINGKETFFVEKISKSVKSILFKNSPPLAFPEECIYKDFDYVAYAYVKPKPHTIRQDKNNRWKVGTLIHFYINARQKNMFRFAPVLPVVSTQKIEIIYIPFFESHSRPWVKIDGKLFYDVSETLKPQMLQFAQNDGFDTIEDFFNYFDKDYTGKIIHWTDLKY